MSLFKFADLTQAQSPSPNEKANSLAQPYNGTFISGQTKQCLEETIGCLCPGQSVFFETDGAWSNIELLEHVLLQAGPSDVYFTTWSISEEAIRRFSAWKENGAINDLFVVLDAGLRNRKPEIYQSALAVFPLLKIAHCHAKCTVISNGTHHFTLITSANYTKNPRKEVGMIIYDEALATKNANWIKALIYGE